MDEKTRVLLVDITGDWLGSEAVEGRFSHIANKAVRPLISYPIGLMYLAASAKKAFGNAVDFTVVSTALDCPTLDAVKRLAQNKKPQIIGIRALSMHKEMYAQIVRELRLSLEGIVILGGGPYPSSEPIEALQGGLVDAVVSGEGEEAFVQILTAYRRDDYAWGAIPNVYTKANAASAHRCSVPVTLPLDDIPFPEYSKSLVAKYERVKNMSRRYTRHANVVSSRGCPYKCTYCHNIFGKKFRFRSEDNVFDEVRHLYEECGIREFQFIDDIFNLRKSRLIAFFDKVAKSGLPLIFSFPNGVRGDILDKESIDAMIDGGTRYLFFAVETASHRIQTMIRKNLRLDRLADNIEHAASRECVTGGFFMFGFPTETLSEVQATIDYACATNLTDGYFFVVTHYPGTEMYNHAIEHGFEPSNEDGVNFFKTKRGAYNFSQEDLAAISKLARKEFYFSEKRIDLKRKNFPTFFSPKEITEITVSQIISCDYEGENIRDGSHREYMAPFFDFAKRVRSMGIRYDF